MKEYQLPEDAEADRLEAEGQKSMERARAEDDLSDEYFLLTVPFATVSLFCGLSTKFGSPGLRASVVLMALVIFIVASVRLGLMPVE